MKLVPPILSTLLGAVLLLVSQGSLAQWELDNERSSVSFISVKNSRIGETHEFTSLVGYIGADGKVQLGVDLDSVETLIPIRNERMRELLFETSRFPAANITSQVQPDILVAVSEEGVVTTEIAVDLSLHGQTVPLTIPVVVVTDSAGTLRVFSAQPVVVDAKQFDLVDGIDALREIAGLKSISTAVPVSINLVFTPAS